MEIYPNLTVVFQWLLFMTALAALNFAVFRPVLHLIRERKERTSGERKKADELRVRAEGLLNECEAKMAEARMKGARERDAQIREALADSKQILQETRREMAVEMEGLKQSLDNQYRQATLQLKRYADELGEEILNRILERKQHG